MDRMDQLAHEVDVLKDRLSRLSQASLRINESLDFQSVLQGVLDSACYLTGSRYGVIILVDQSGQVGDFLSSGMTPEQTALFTRLPAGTTFFEYLNMIEGPLRLRDFQGYVTAHGLPEFRPPFPVSPALPFMAAPLRHRGERFGAIYVGETESGREFTPEDEETLVMFASQAALVIANAQRHREERRAGADLASFVPLSALGL